MTGIELYSTSAASNNSAVPNGFPEGMAPSGVNDAARQVMASIRTWYEASEWVNLGHTPTYIGATQFSLTTDLTATYQVGRRIKAVGTTPFTIYGTISVSSYASVTTVTVVWDSGSLNSTLASVALSAASVTNPSIGFAAIKGVSVALGSQVTGDLPFANLTQGAALTVLANATNGTADFADVAAASDFQVFRRSGTALAFGSVNLASSNAVTGVLPAANLAAATTGAQGASELATTAETQTGTDTVRTTTPAGIKGALLFSKGFLSSDITLGSGDQQYATQAHSLGATPFFVSAHIRCTSTDQGYAVGDCVNIMTAFNSSQKGLLVQYDATNVRLIQSDALEVFNKSTSAVVDADPTKWVGVIKAWI